MIKYNAFYQLTTGQIEMAKHKIRVGNSMFYFFDPDFLPDGELWTIKDGKPYKVLVDYVTESDFNEALTSKDLAIITGRRASDKTSFVEIFSRIQEFEGLYILEMQVLSHVPRRIREHAGIVIDLKREGLEWLENYERRNLDIVNAYPSALQKGREAIAKRVMERSYYGILFEPSDKHPSYEKLKQIQSDIKSDIYSTLAGDLISLLEQGADNKDIWMVIRKIRKLIKERKEVEEAIDKIKRLEERHNGKV